MFGDPREQTLAGLESKASGNGSRALLHVVGHRAPGHFFVEVREDPLQGRCEGSFVAAPMGGPVLALSSRSVGRADQQAGDVVGVGLTEVAAQDMEAEVDRREHPAGAQDLAVVDVQLLVSQLRARERGPELVRQCPVGRDAAPREYAGLPEDERTPAQGHQSGTSAGGGGDRPESLGVLAGQRVVDAGNDHRVGVGGRAPGLGPARDPDVRPSRRERPQSSSSYGDSSSSRILENTAGRSPNAWTAIASSRATVPGRPSPRPHASRGGPGPSSWRLLIAAAGRWPKVTQVWRGSMYGPTSDRGRLDPLRAPGRSERTRRGGAVGNGEQGSRDGRRDVAHTAPSCASHTHSEEKPPCLLPSDQQPPTVVLVHGAFADAGSWAPVTERLVAAGIPVMAIVNPLRGVQGDAAYVASVINQIPGPVLAVGHSYGGMIITNAVPQTDNVVGLVYVAAFAPMRARPSRASSAAPGQRPDHRGAGEAVPDRRRVGDGRRADHRPRPVPGGLHRRPVPVAVRRLRPLAAADRGQRPRRRDRAPGVEGPPGLGCGRHRGQGRRSRRRAVDGSAGRRRRSPRSRARTSS